MDDDRIRKITMPKWGLSMAQGKVVSWLVAEGEEVGEGASVAEVETEKITGVVESPQPGKIRRLVGQVGQVIPVGGLLALIADPSVSDDEIDQCIAQFEPVENEVDTQATQSGPEYIEVEGRRLRYLHRGEGEPPALLIHGFGGSLNNWLFNHSALAAERSVYALELPGHGQSSIDVGDGSLEFLATTVLAWLDAMELPLVHVAGHSLGGAIALAVAAGRPERFASCTLIASAGLGPEIDHECVAGMLGATRRKEVKPHLEKLYADSGLVTRQLVDDFLRFRRLDGVGEALEKIAANLLDGKVQAWRLERALTELPIPALVIWGAEDRILPPTQATNASADAEVVVLEKGGHMVHMESASDVNRIVNDFMKAASAGNAP